MIGKIQHSLFFLGDKLCGNLIWFTCLHLKIVNKGGLYVSEHNVVHKLVIFHADNDIIKKIIFVLCPKKFSEVGFRNEATKTSYPKLNFTLRR